MLHPSIGDNKKRKSSSPTRLNNEGRREFHPLLNTQWSNLHRTYGNQAVQRMLSSAPAEMPMKRAFASASNFHRAADKGTGATPASKPTPPAPAPAAMCRPQSLTYANETRLSCPPGKCGVKFKFDVTKVNT